MSEILFYGEANGNRLFEADTGYQDVDEPIAILAESDPASTSLAQHSVLKAIGELDTILYGVGVNVWVGVEGRIRRLAEAGTNPTKRKRERSG